jgi:hypothetical protein
MPLDAQSALLRLSPMGGIDLGGPGDSLELERMKLARQQFAETRRANAEQERMMRERERGEQRRAELMVQKQREADEAAAKAAREEEKRKLQGEFAKYRDAGDVEGIEALIPSIQATGANIDRLGEDEFGLPSYQIDWDGEAAAKAEEARAAQASPYGEGETAVQSLDRLGALGYPSLSERGNLDDPSISAPITTEDAFNRGRAASQHFEETGQPLRQPDATDWPKNVVDFGAMQAQVARRLDPALGAFQSAHPERMQDSVGKTNEAAAGMALPAPKALELAKSLRAGPDAAMADEFKEEFDREKAARDAAPKPLTREDIQRLSQGGATEAAEMYKNRGIDDTFTRSSAAQSMIDILEDDDPDNDMAIAFELPNMLGSRGAQSNRDLAVALGDDSMSTVKQFRERLARIIEGGFTEMKKATLIGIIKNKMEKDDALVYEFLDAIDEAANNTDDEAVRHGLEKYAVGNVPKIYRDAWLEARAGAAADEEGDEEEPAEPGPARRGVTTVNGVEEPEAEQQGASFDPEEIEDELAAQAEEAGLDVEQIRPLMRTESGTNPTARNHMGSSASGLFQFTDKTARAYGLKNAAAYAALPPAEQIRLGIRRFKAIGLDANSSRDDYAMANAAPAYRKRPDDTVIEEYRSGTEQGDDVRAKNPGWIPADGGEITVGSIKAFYRGTKAKAAKADKAEGKKTSRLDKSVDDILR